MTTQHEAHDQSAKERNCAPVVPKDSDAIEMEVFRTGDYGAKGVWAESDLDQLAKDYSPSLLEAPLTFDHAQSGPAFGWVKSLQRVGDRLVAHIAHVPEAVREVLRSGAYKKRSVEILRRFSVTGRPYLRAISLLGAASPAVPGLREICFSKDAEVIAFEDDEEVIGLRLTVAQLRHELEKFRAERCRSRARDVVAQARQRGVALTEREAELIESFCLAFDEARDVVRFGADEVSPLAWLSEFIRARGPEVPKGEISFSTIASADGSLPHSCVPEPGADPTSVALHERALALQESDGRLTYAAALSAAARSLFGRRQSRSH